MSNEISTTESPERMTGYEAPMEATAGPDSTAASVAVAEPEHGVIETREMNIHYGSFHAVKDVSIKFFWLRQVDCLAFAQPNE